ncbi:unnamed protein product [Rodentolepis nana]|uniref:Conserved secreted protein n=1 Tax=Rodentolepis nana TaxID=102285 RepID=A0A0R3TYJ4_RODNA|nr:unnamed protein product [Rodentolepis nana]
MKIGFVFFLCALTGLIAEARRVENLPQFSESLFEPSEPAVKQEPVEENVTLEEADGHISTAEFEESTTESSFYSSETSTPLESQIDMNSAISSSATISTMEPMITLAYTDDFHPDPFLAAAIKAAESPIYQRIREPPSEGYNYDFLQEM